jgi:hypothetical protein
MYPNKKHQNLIKELAKKYNYSTLEMQQLCWSPFRFAMGIMTKVDKTKFKYPVVGLMCFGKFRVNTKKLKWLRSRYEILDEENLF